MRIVFWQNILSPHQSSLIRALASRASPVILVSQETLPSWRRDCGWEMPDFGKAQFVIAPDQKMVSRTLTEADSESVHIFSASRVDTLVWKAFLACRFTRAKIGIYSEAYNWNGPKGILRLLRGRCDTWRFQPRVNFVLPIGHLGIRWFLKVGYPVHKLYQFGYFVEQPLEQVPENYQLRQSDGGQVKLAFIGQCIRRKGIDILLQALSGLQHLNWNLQIVGDGDKKGDLEKLTLRLGLSEKVRFIGALKNFEARLIMKTCDLFILPSRWDGWGAVVNEALMEGVPVVCSDFCGSADLLSNPERGETFSTGKIMSLREILARRIAQGKRTAELSARIKKWSIEIQGEAAANYLLNVIAASAYGKPRPVPPWL